MNSTNSLKFLDKYFFGFLALIFGPFVKLFSSSKKPNKEEIRKILIIKLWAMGDSIMTLPMIKAIKEKYPDAEIDVAVKPNDSIVFKKHKFIDKIMLIQPKNFFSLIKMFKKYDVVFDLEPYLNLSAIAASYCGKKRIGFSHGIRKLFYTNTINFNKTKHIAKMYFEMARFIDVFQENNKKNNLIKSNKTLIELKYSKDAEKKVNEILKREKISKKDVLIGFNPSVGASVKEREWPKENFRLLAEKILKNKRLKNAKIILIGTKNDFELNEYIKKIDKLKNNKTNKIINLSGKFNLEELFCLIKKMKLMVSNDTGPMHIAAAQGVKTIGLFGPNTPAIWGPYGDKNISIFHPKKGCPFLNNTKHTLVPKHLTKEQKTCMDAIKVEEVLKEILKSK